MRAFFCCFAMVLFAALADAKEPSLDEIRGELLGQEIVILGNAFPAGIPGYEHLTPTANKLVDWFFMEGNEGTGYTRSKAIAPYAPTAMRGQKGRVVAVQETTSLLNRSRAGQLDAFGKPIAEASILNPYITVVVRTADGQALIGSTGYYITLMGSKLQLASRADRLKEEMAAYLEKLIGRRLYKTEFSQLLRSGLSLSDLLDRNRRLLSRDTQTANLTALTVIEARHLEAENAVVLKVALPNGEERLLYGELRNYERADVERRSQLERMGIRIGEEVPAKFSNREIAAIRKGEIFRGMSKEALFWSYGYPEKSNDWGRGGQQYIYGGTEYVYTDGARVTDWQSLR